MTNPQPAFRERAPAKINLYLHVLDRRPDGYHELDSLVAFASAHDVIEITVSDSFTLTVDGPFTDSLAATPAEDNLALRAAQAAVAASGAASTAFAVRLTKNLPVASGLGGGSADAAAVLRASGHVLGLTRETLLHLAADLGADVPVCVHARTMHMAGVGDRLTSAPQLPGASLVLVCPQIPVDTADVYSRWLRNADPPALPLGSTVRDVQSLADFLHAHRNDLTAPAQTIAPQIADVVQALADNPGCLLARMSGSGPACFGLFGDAGDAAEALVRISSTRPEWWAVVTQLEVGEVLA